MTETQKNDINERLDSRIAEFVAAAEVQAISSSSLIQEGQTGSANSPVLMSPAERKAEVSPVFTELSQPKLPVLRKENRAQLQMQSPNSLYFYWSVKDNPVQTLNNVLGGEAGNYMLVAKLVDLKRNSETINRIDGEGSWWFDVEAGGEYRAEIGFYSPSRPFVRVLFSNSVQTPVKSPSKRPASASEWHVTADKFADVLNVSGFRQDAFDVALVGDDPSAADAATYAAFAKLIDGPTPELNFDGQDIRYALFAIASGISLDQIRHRIGARLSAELEKRGKIVNRTRARSAIKEGFGAATEEFLEEEEVGPAVFGASLINFPKRYRGTRSLGELEPFSSFSIGSK